MPTFHKVAANASSNKSREDVNSNGKVGGLGGGGPSAGIGTNRQQNNFNRVDVVAQENNQSSITNTLAPSSKKIKYSHQYNNNTPCNSVDQQPPTRSRSRRVSRKSPLNSNAKQLNSNGTTQSNSIAIKSPAPPSLSNPSFPIFEDSADNSKSSGGAADDSAISKISDEDIVDTIINGEDGSASLSSFETIGCLVIEEEFAQESTTSTSTTNKNYSGDDGVQNLLNTLTSLHVEGGDIVEACVRIYTASGNKKKRFVSTTQKRLIKAVERYQTAKANPLEFDAVKLENLLNTETDEDFKELSESGWIDKESINLFHVYSRFREVLGYLAYAPEGTEQIGNHTMPEWQCCIRIESQSTPRMLKYLITGVYPENKIYTKYFGCIDRAFTTIKKFKLAAELDEQYDIVAKLLGFANRFEYFVYSIIALINNNTLAIVARKNADFELPTTVSSSSTASVVYGMNGIERHSSSSSKGNTIFTLHPQAKISANGKKKVYQPYVDDMNYELLRTILPALNLTEEERQKALSGEIKVDFFQRFGQEYREEIDIPMDEYSSLASKVVLEDGTLDLSSLTPHALAGYEHQVSVHGEEKVLNLLHRFKTNHKLRTYAAKLSDNIVDIDDVQLSLLPSVIEAGRILNTKPHLIVNQLKRIKRAITALGLRSELAALLDENDKLPTDTATRAKFDKLVSLTRKKNKEDVMQQLCNTKASQDALVLRSKLATTLDENDKLPDDPGIKAKFDKFVGSTSKKNEEDAMQQLCNTKAAQDDNGELLKLRNELATTLDENDKLPDDPGIKAKFVEFTNLIKIKTADNALQQLRNTKPKKREMVDEPDEPSETTSEPSKDQLREWGF